MSILEMIRQTVDGFTGMYPAGKMICRVIPGLSGFGMKTKDSVKVKAA